MEHPGKNGPRLRTGRPGGGFWHCMRRPGSARLVMKNLWLPWLELLPGTEPMPGYGKCGPSWRIRWYLDSWVWSRLPGLPTVSMPSAQPWLPMRPSWQAWMEPLGVSGNSCLPPVACGAGNWCWKPWMRQSAGWQDTQDWYPKPPAGVACLPVLTNPAGGRKPDAVTAWQAPGVSLMPTMVIWVASAFLRNRNSSCARE